MKRFTRPRRLPWLGLGLVIAGLATAATVAIAGLQPADLTYTPNSESQMTNIDVARAYAKNYYGAPNAVAGSGATATWSTPLNMDSNYAAEAESVAGQASNWLKARSKVANRALVLDVDDTTLTTWNYELYSNWDFNVNTNSIFVGLTPPPAGSPAGTPSTWTGNMFPPTPGMLDLVNQAKAEGYAIFWITGRGDSQHQATVANLQNDAAANLPNIDSVTLSGFTIPEVDANYPAPTPLAIGHGGYTDGLFTKPPVGSYPAYLNTPDFCGPNITAGTSCPTIQYKSGTRAYIESQGYDVVADIGDQFSDLLGGYADKTFKMPNPNYYLP
jgi:predicted secreted acid phosphatase